MDSGFNDMAKMQERGRENHSSTHTHIYAEACQVKPTGELGGHFKIQLSA